MTSVSFHESRSGQALLELLLSTTLIVLTVTGAGWVLSAEFRRIRCAQRSFEQAHSNLHNRLQMPRFDVEIEETDLAVRARAHCDVQQEDLALRKLEAIEW